MNFIRHLPPGNLLGLVAFAIALIALPGRARAGDVAPAGDKTTSPCGPGYIGPFPTVLTMYVSHKPNDPGSLSTKTRKQVNGKWKGTFCDKDGAKDEPGGGETIKPSARRFTGKGSGAVGAVPQDSKYYHGDYKIMGGGDYDGIEVHAGDHIGGTLNGQAVKGSPIQQIDISTDCDTYEKNKQGVTKVMVCVKAPGGTEGGMESGPPRHTK